MTTKADSNKETSLTEEHKSLLANAAHSLYTSAHIAIDDIEERLKKLEAYLKGLFEKE